MKRLILLVYLFSTVHFANATIQKENTNSKPLNICVSFIKWYMRHQPQLYKFYPINEHPGDSTKPYKLNPRQLNRYLKYLNQSGYLSDYFLFRRQLYFTDIGATLKKYPQWDGPIPRYESTDPFEVAELEIDGVDHLKIKLISQQFFDDKHASVVFTISGLKFTTSLTLTNGKWLIDTIN